MSVVLCPVVDQAGHLLVPGSLLDDLWCRMAAEGKVEDVFYAGGVASRDDFQRFVTAHGASMVVAIDRTTGAPRGIVWLTNVHDGSAFIHYCVVGRLGRHAARDVLRFFAALRLPDGRPMLDRLIGITPEKNLAAVRALHLLGFTTIGTIPGYCRLAHHDDRCGGVISYYQLRSSESPTGEAKTY